MGIWAAQSLATGGRLTRVAGRYKNSTTDSLLSLALVSGLQSISSKRVQILTESLGGRKPKIQVMCGNPSFIEAFSAENTKPALFINSYIIDKLKRLLDRFDLCFEYIDPQSSL